ncbi:MAG: hypothetical protein JXB47_00085 [Anaerolineae bacterium]|nr:hypothetical protein [Anaerolineae bacterium]
MSADRSFLKDNRQAAWVLVVVLLFVLVYLGSLTFVYIEGDDAATVAYHIMGRNRDLQIPYAPYHGMMDVVLSTFPADQNTLLTGAVLITGVSTVIMTVLMLALAFDWVGEVSWSQKLLIAALVLLASPEFFYLGLVYSPASVAMCLVLAAHLILRYRSRDAGLPGRWPVVLSLLLFGLGVSFRWSVLVYGAVIALDLLVGVGRRLDRSRLVFVVGWGVAALVASVLAILISGYGPQEILSSTQSTVSYVAGQAGGQQVESGPAISFRTLTTLLSLFTPAFAIFFMVGLVVMLRRRDARLWLLVVGLAGVAPYLTSGVPKFLITAIPAVLLCAVEGFVTVWYRLAPARWELIARVAAAVVVIVPWFLGVLVTQEGSAWGPGFEIRPYDRDEVEGTDIGLTIGSGAALPSPEGGRAFFGHFFTFGGGWRALYTELAAEYDTAVQQAVENNIPLVMMRWSPSYITNALVAARFITGDAYGRMLPPDDYFVERRFFNLDGQVITFLYHETEGEGDEDDVKQLCALAALSDRVVLDGYPRFVRGLYEQAPGAFQRLGSTSAIVDLGQLCK